MRYLSKSALRVIKQRSMVALEVLEISTNPPYDEFDLLFVRNLVNLRIGNDDYIALGFNRQPIQTQSTFSIDRTALEIDDVLGYFAKLSKHKPMAGMRARLRKIFVPDSASAADGILLYDGFLGTPHFDDVKVSVEVRSILGYRDTDLPHRTYQPNCNSFLGDAWCGIDMSLPENTRYVTAGPGSHSRVVFSGDLDKPENYWLAGWVKVESGSMKGQVRPIKASGVGFVKLEVPFEGDPTGQIVRVVRGCRKDKIDCNGRYQNGDQYSGFAEVPKTPSIDRVVATATTGGSNK